MRIPTENLDYRDTYRLLSGSIVPRPIAWVTTRDPASGVVNLAPFSFFTGCSVIPPMVCFAVERRWGQKKDTIRNIEAAGEFVLNVPSVSHAQAVVLSAKDFGPEVSEVEETGLHLVPSDLVQTPRVAEAPIHMECKLHQIVELGTSPHSLVIGHVVQFHLHDDVYDNGRINFERLDALGRLAGDLYCSTRDQINITRLDFRKESY